jgi:uncharacterized membrane protein (UPF0127 family)
MFELVKKHTVLFISGIWKSILVMSLPGRTVTGLFFIIVSALGSLGTVHSDENKDVVFKRSELIVVSASNSHHFRIELAKSAAALRRGLMERRRMDDDAGMLFDYSTPKKINMWMKNTFIPLDMLFIDKFGKIVRIVENTTPLSIDTIASLDLVLAVLELNGGTAKRLSIKLGDKVIHDIFQP